MWFYRFAFYLASLLLLLALWGISRLSPPPTSANPQAPERFTPAELAWLERPQAEAPAAFQSPGLNWMRAYRDGQLLAYRWGQQPIANEWPAFVRAAGAADHFELGQALRNEASAAGGKRLAEEGLWGFEFRHLPGPIRCAPQDLVRTRLTPPELIRRVRRNHNTRLQGCFRARVALVRAGGSASEMLRSSPYFARHSLNHEVVRGFAELLGRSLLRQAELNQGLTPYRVTLPAGEFSEEGMLIVRPCLAAWALARWGRQHPADLPAVRRNLHELFSRFGRSLAATDHFVVEYQGDRPLGALALTGLALRALGEEPGYEEALARALLSMQDPQGWFHTRYQPSYPSPAPRPDPRRDRNQLFYPPEAMLYLAERYAGQPSPRWKAPFDKAFEYYRDQFWREPHPPLVPWFVQACARMHQATGEARYAHQVFAMQDWHLANLQPWEQVAPPDLRGGPVQPRSRDYGEIAHSSSCGVHLEGLVEAYALARRMQDPQRRERYRRAMMESLGYLIQCQYRSEADLYWIAPPLRSRFLGGIRNSPADGAIQVDNGAHALNAVLSILEQVPPSEFHLP